MIRLQLFGPAALAGPDGRELAGLLAQPKRFALLAYLATAPAPTRHRRDTLLALFWPESDDEHARASLRQTLYELRRSLGRGVLHSEGKDLVAVDAGALWCDTAEFTALLERGCDGEALAHYRGPFLDGFHLAGAPDFERWQSQQSRRFQTEAAAAAWRLSGAAETTDPAAARRWAARACALAPYDETGLRRYMELLCGQGDRATAVRAYDRFAGRLASDLGLSASAETMALVDRIRRMGMEPGNERGRAAEGSSTEGIGHPKILPDGPVLDTAEPDRSGTARDRSGRRLAIFSTGVLLVASVVWSLTRIVPAPLDDRLIAVFPFRTAGATAAVHHLGEGLMDVVATALTGREGMPSAISPRTMDVLLARSRDGAAPDLGPDAALAMAREQGAGRLLTGAIVGDDRQVTIHWSLVEVGSGEALLHASVSAPPDSVDRLATGVVARVVGAQAGISPERISALTTRSLPALRAYLEGRQAMRRGRHVEAVHAFDRAVSLDTTFALAALSLRRVQAWANMRGVNSPRALRLAHRGYDQLSQEDRLYLDGLPDLIDGDEWLQLRIDAARLVPNSPDLRFQLGDFYYHFGSALDIDDAHERARLHLAAALEADTAYLEPLIHLHDLALARGDFEAARRYGDRIMAFDSTSLTSLRVRHARSRYPGLERPQEPLFYDTLPIGFLARIAAHRLLDLLPPEPEVIEALERAVERPLPEHERRKALDALYTAAVHEGRPGLLRKVMAESRLSPEAEALNRLTLALLWLQDEVSAKTAAADVRSFLESTAEADVPSHPATLAGCALALWQSVAGDGAAAAATAHTTAATWHGVNIDTAGVFATGGRNTAVLCEELVAADRAVRAGAPEAGRLLDRVDRELARWPALASATIAEWNLHVARLWQQLGRHERALVTARRWARDDLANLFRVDALLVEAQSAARLGRRSEAIRAYRQFIDWRWRAEPPFADEVAVARSRLALLQRTSGP